MAENEPGAYDHGQLVMAYLQTHGGELGREISSPGSGWSVEPHPQGLAAGIDPERRILYVHDGTIPEEPLRGELTHLRQFRDGSYYSGMPFHEYLTLEVEAHGRNVSADLVFFQWQQTYGKPP